MRVGSSDKGTLRERVVAHEDSGGRLGIWSGEVLGGWLTGVCHAPLVVVVRLRRSGPQFGSPTAYLIAGNDSLFTKRFFSILEGAGGQFVRPAVEAPDRNAFVERWVQSVKRECLSKMILLCERHLRRVLSERRARQADRPHQEIDNRLATPRDGSLPRDGEVVVGERLAGLLHSYRRLG